MKQQKYIQGNIGIDMQINASKKLLNIA